MSKPTLNSVKADALSKGHNFELARRIAVGEATQDEINLAKRLTSPERAKQVGAHANLVFALARASKRTSARKPAVTKTTKARSVEAAPTPDWIKQHGRNKAIRKEVFAEGFRGEEFTRECEARGLVLLKDMA